MFAVAVMRERHNIFILEDIKANGTVLLHDIIVVLRAGVVVRVITIRTLACTLAFNHLIFLIGMGEISSKKSGKKLQVLLT